MLAILCAIVWGVFAVICLIISILSFMKKGFLFNNAYIWASKSERENMDKKPYYRQSAIAFALCFAVFLCMAIESVLLTGWLWIAVGAICIAIFVYTIASSKKITE